MRRTKNQYYEGKTKKEDQNQEVQNMSTTVEKKIRRTKKNKDTTMWKIEVEIW